MPDVVSGPAATVPAVEAAVEHDDVGTASGLPAEPKCRLDRLAAGVGEEHLVTPGRKHCAQPFHQREQRAVHDGFSPLPVDG